MAAVRMRVVRACRGFSRSRRMTVRRIAELVGAEVCDGGVNLFIAHQTTLTLRHLEHVGNQFIISLVAILFEPPDNVRAPAHVADSNDLLQTVILCGNS